MAYWEIYQLGMEMRKVVVVIPARWGSRRLPGKPLMPLLGKPLIQHIYEQARLAKEPNRVVVATDDTRIEKTVKGFGGEVISTTPTARTGSDRVAELIGPLQADVYVNLQGDHILSDPSILDELIRSFLGSPSLEMGTLMQKLEDPKEIKNPNVVKIVPDTKGFALYFSRSPIPFYVEDPKKSPDPHHQSPNNHSISRLPLSPSLYMKHVGIYIFEKETLRRFSLLPTGHLEACEQLEQLRALENGIKIRVWETHQESYRIDNQQDLKNVARILKRKSREETNH